MLIDTHCHLGDERFESDCRDVVARAAAAGVGHVVIVADSAPATERAVALARQFGLSATAGVHPHEAFSWDDDVAARVKLALEDPAVVAVGETGLDYHYEHSLRDVQRRAFEAQLTLAAETGKTVVVHSRDADADMSDMLGAAHGSVPIVMHSFSAGSRVFEAGMDRGAYFSFSGMVTFKNWKLDDYLMACSEDRLLLETDAPYLAPHPHRGKRNEPAYLKWTAQRVATVRGITVGELERLTTANAGRCFGERVTTSEIRYE